MMGFLYRNSFLLVGIVISAAVCCLDAFLGVQTHFHFNNILEDFEFMQFDVILVTFVSVLLGKFIDLLRTRLRIIKNSRKRLRDKNNQLTEIMLNKEKMNSLIAHDLKSPFNGYMGLLNLLIDNFDAYDDAKKLEILKALQESTNNTYNLLLQLLEISKINSGTVEVNYQTVKLFDIIHEQFSLLKTNADQKMIELQNNAPPEVWIEADVIMAGTIIRNLVSNAIKFCEAGDHIKVEVVKNADDCVITVSDSGVGIPKKVLENIKKDKIISGKGTANEQGTGLGLAICKSIMAKHGGTLDVDSVEGEGTTVELKFPNQPFRGEKETPPSK